MAFIYREESSHSEELSASTMAEALELAEKLCRGGEWGDEGASVSVDVIQTDEDGAEIDRESITVEIEPDHSHLIKQAVKAAGYDAKERSCGNNPDDHDWTSEGEGGLKENPGVWSTGGTSLLTKDHCCRCGLHRTQKITGSQRNPGEHDRTEYEMPDEWTAAE